MASTDEEQRTVPSGGDMETSGDVEEVAVDDIVKEKGSTIEFSLEGTYKRPRTMFIILLLVCS